ncbi:MAG: hypothetical protein JO129_04005 [Candidatus Dependentiae bacterium]|nr:hypothetical protein [Candidatus Dependentiae bacterium]
MLLHINQQKELFPALLYLNMRELKNICLHFGLPTQSEKIKLIESIELYVTTGKITQKEQIPTISKAKTKTIYLLAPETRILKGSFKNDLKTRVFLKTLIGNHFHYTAYGIDWIKKMWMQGTPPTYAEFATYWQQEYQNRQITKAPLKEEWAYLNFLDNYQKLYPTASKSQAIAAWKIEREMHVAKVQEILNLKT